MLQHWKKNCDVSSIGTQVVLHAAAVSPSESLLRVIPRGFFILGGVCMEWFEGLAGKMGSGICREG